jgi:hypothetical protein
MDPTYILPICGTDFPRDIAFFSILARTFIRPKLIISASGGCMISYTAMMSDFEAIIEEWSISSKLFAYKLIPVVPRLVSFLISGSLYKRPNIDDFIRANFPQSKLKNVEIISGYYSDTREKVVLSTNFGDTNESIGITIATPGLSGISGSGDTRLNGNDFDLTKVDVEYCNGDFEMILRSIEATTNIPLLLPPLGKDARIDFGIHSPSPLTFIKRTSHILDKVIYFSPINILETYKSDMKELMFLNTIQTEILRLTVGFNNFTDYNPSDMSFLSRLLVLNKYVLIIYTTVNIDMSIANFTSYQVKEYVKRIKNDTHFRLYY